jgi:tetratricopeptide (TPR) repeat protein
VASDRPTVLRDAEKLVRQGQLSRALEEYERALDEQPRDWTTLNIVGDLHVRLGQEDQAVDCFMRIADGLLLDGFLARASAFYRKVLKLRPSHEEALLGAARTAADQRLTAEARTYLERAAVQRRARGDRRGVAEIAVLLAKATPGDLDARRTAIDARVELGDSEGAARDLVVLAAEYAALGRGQDAADSWDRAGSLAPTRLVSWLAELAAARTDAGYPLVDLLVARDIRSADWASAADRLEAFVGAKRDNIAAHQRLVDILIDGELHERLTRAQARLAEAYLTAGMAAEARFVAEDLMTAEPSVETHEALFRRAVVQLGADPDAAVEERRSRQASLGDPVDTPAVILEPSLEAVADSFQPEAAVEPDLMEVDLHVELTELGAPEPALDAAPVLDDVFAQFRREAADRLADHEADAELVRGETLVGSGRRDEGLRALETSARTPRLRFRAASLIAHTHRDAGQLRQAVDWFERAAEAPAPTHEAGRALLYELADTLERLDESERALAILLELETEAGAYRDVRVRIGRLTAGQRRG